MAFFKVGVGESNCKILSFIICALAQKWYQMKAEISNFNINPITYKSVHYSRKYCLKSIAGPKKNQPFFVFCTIKFSAIST